MICPDVNLLLFATFRSFPEHENVSAKRASAAI